MQLSRAELLTVHDGQLRGRQPQVPPVGSVVELDDEIVRTHYGTHGVVDHRDLGTGDLTDLVAAQQTVFAARGEPAEWKVYDHDSPGLASALLAAGFSPGWRRSLLIAPTEVLCGEISSSVKALELEPDSELRERAVSLATMGGPHRAPLAKLETDGMDPAELCTLVLHIDGQNRGLGWAHHLEGTDFIEIGGLTGPHPEFLPYWARWSRRGPRSLFGWTPPESRYAVAEADGTRREMLIAAGFQEVSTVQSYHWAPAEAPPTERPVRWLLGGSEYERIWDLVYARLSFKPDTEVFPGIDEPTPSVTWSLDRIDGDSYETLIGPLTEVVNRGLLAVVPAEDLYWLDWHHAGYRFDPQRVGRDGQPDWPGLSIRMVTTTCV